MRHSARFASIALATSFVFLSACFERPLAALTPCTRARVGENISLDQVEDVDLLFVIDDSGSMMEEQSELIAEIPRLVHILATGDSGLDGTVDFHPARSIHVGIVSSDMGVYSASDVSSCQPGFGDDGVLRAAPASCAGTERGPVFAFAQGDDPAAFASAVGCAANLGTMGCAEEQPLESMLKALSPSGPQIWTIPGYEAPTFIGGVGHGGELDTNGGLVRTSSVLAIILISDENDSSTLNPDLFVQDDPRYVGGTLSLRGFFFPDELTPVQRYVRGLLALRNTPSHLVFGAITGVPVDAIDDQDYQAMLDRPEMVEQVDPARTDRLLPSCRGPFQTDGAYPGRRAIELARDLHAAGAGTTVGSICDGNFEGALDEIIRLIGEAFRGTCLPRPLNVDSDGRVPCQVSEVLLPIGTAVEASTHCASLGTSATYALDSMETVEVNGELVTREVCRIHQLSREEHAAGTGGWFYDDAPTQCPQHDGVAQQVAMQNITLVDGAELRFSCDEHIQGSGSPITLGTFCNPGAAVDTCAAGLAPDHRTPLTCDGFTRACAVRCGNDSACTAAGLPGHQCDQRMARDLFGDAMPGGLDPFATHDVCVNAICQ